MWAVVPVKDFRAAKSRLAGVLAPEERRLLYSAMLTDVLDTLAQVGGLDQVVVLTRDPEAGDLASRFGARVLPEDDNLGQSRAVTRAAAVLAWEGVSTMLTLPGDVPLVTTAEIEAVMEAHGRCPALTVVPSLAEEGTNCLVCSPPEVIPFCFGPDSFRLHLAAAEEHGLEPRVLRLPGLGLDLDTPDDLDTFLRHPPRTRAHTFLAARDLETRREETGGRRRSVTCAVPGREP